MSEWKEYPECPHCGAIQKVHRTVLAPTIYDVCHSCSKHYKLRTLRRFRTEKLEETK